MKKCAQNKIHNALRRMLAAMLAFILALNLLAPNAVMAKSTETESPLTTEELNTIAEINSYLGLASQKTASGKETLEINGSAYNEDFYWDALDQDSRVPFDGPISYARYLIDAWNDPDSIKSNEYLKVDADESLTGQEAVKLVWDTYLYDLYDSTDKLEAKNTTEVKTGAAKDFGDSSLGYYKDDGTDFHETTLTTGNNLIKNLTYDYLENGVDYSAFMGNIDKTAKKIGEREYQIDLSAQAQAKVKGAVAMVVNVQTSWQMFDLEHANATKQTLTTMEVGAIANNTEICSLYHIKRALLRFNDYMQENYPGNNLALDVITFGHNGTYSMINGETTVTTTKDNGKTETKTYDQYLSNDYNTIRNGLLGWDIFGNCEHNHYSAQLLKTIGQTIKYDVAGWTDINGEDISNKVSKVLVNIGGATEDSNGENGYKLELPWSSFSDYNSVYGIRTNEGTSISTSGLISWLDYSANNTGSPFKDGKGTNFTKKYVASDEDALFDTLVEIAEKEIAENSIPNTSATDKYVENVKLQDTVSKEFTLDESSIQAIVKDASGNVISSDEIDPAYDENIKISYNDDGTTNISYTYDRVYSGQTVELVFNVTANDDFIGSNNVKTNVGTPSGSYEHTNDKGTTTYNINSTDKPEVNVPVKFDVTDGKSTTISIGQTVDLKTLSADIVKDAENRVDNYSQTNGTLVYSYTLPDGTVVDLGSVKVTNGSIGDQKFSDRSYDFIGTKEGTNNIQLNVKFVPDTMVDNGNYYEDTATKAPAEALEKSGNMVINVLGNIDEAKTTIRVRKIWDKVTEDNQTTPVKFTLYKTVKGVKSPVGEYTITKNDVVTVNGEQIGWTIDIKDLPTVEQVDSSYEAVTYSVEEDATIASKYRVSYTDGEDVDTLYQVNGTVKFSPSDNGKIQSTKPFIMINYTVTHDGKTESKTYTASISEIIGGTNKDFKNNTEYSVTLPLFETTDSNPDYTFEVTDINYIRDNNAAISETKQLPYTISQTVASYISLTSSPNANLKNKYLLISYEYEDGTKGVLPYKVSVDTQNGQSAKIPVEFPEEYASKGNPTITGLSYIDNVIEISTDGITLGSGTITIASAPDNLQNKYLIVNYQYEDGTTDTLIYQNTQKTEKNKSATLPITFPTEYASKGTPTITSMYYYQNDDGKKLVTIADGTYETSIINECKLTVNATPTEKMDNNKYLPDVVIKIDGEEITIPVTGQHNANQSFELYTKTKSVENLTDSFDVKVIRCEYKTVTGDLKAGTIKSTSSQVIASSTTTTKVLEISNAPAGFTIVHVPVKSDGTIDTSNIETNTVVFDSDHYDSETGVYTYDLTTADDYDRDENDCLYAGQYTNESLSTPLVVSGSVSNVPANASTVDTDGGAVDPATAIHPNADQVYYVKEISRAYLRPRTITTWWYPNESKSSEGNQIVDARMLTAVDNANYAAVGFLYTDVQSTGGKASAASATISTQGLSETVTLPIPYGGTAQDGDSDFTYTPYDMYRITGLFAASELPVTLPAIVDPLADGTNEDAVNYAKFTAHAYFDTFDGVRVTGDTIRYIEYKMTDATDTTLAYSEIYQYQKDNKNIANVTTQTISTPTVSNISAPAVVKSLTLKMYNPVTYTVNVVDGNSSTAIQTRGGDVTNLMPTTKDGYRFAGFYSDAAFKKAADLSNVTADMTVYAKYVSDSYLRVNYKETKSRKVVTSVKFVSAVDGKNYTEQGFLISVNGNESTYKCKSLSSSASGFTAKKLVANATKDSKLFSYSLNTKGYTDGTVIQVTPYWITKDGTKVTGETAEYTYYKTGLTK